MWRRLEPASSGPIRLRRAAYSLIPLVLLFGLAEVIARLAGDPPEIQPGQAMEVMHTGMLPKNMMADPVIGWVGRPGAVIIDSSLAQAAKVVGGPSEDPTTTRNDAWGHRDEDPPQSQGPGARQVLLLGDSSMWGFGIPWEFSLERQLEKLSVQNGRPVDVIDGALPGWSSVQMLLALDRWLDAGLKADVVIAYLGVSDTMLTTSVPDEQWAGDALSRARPIFGQFASFRWALALRDRFLPAPRPTSGPRVTPAAAVDIALGLNRRCQDAGAKLIVLVSTSPPDRDYRATENPAVTDEASAAACEEVIRGTTSLTMPSPGAYRCASALAAYKGGFPRVDGPAAMRAEWATGAEGLFWDGIHPSSAGHGVLARAVWPVLENALPKP